MHQLQWHSQQQQQQQSTAAPAARTLLQQAAPLVIAEAHMMFDTNSLKCAFEQSLRVPLQCVPRTVQQVNSALTYSSLLTDCHIRLYYSTLQCIVVVSDCR
jgi:hypothetical protein